MKNKTLICTVGLPRSGKSTWAKQQGVPVVNPDSIRLAIHGQAFIASAEPVVWAVAKYMVKALFLAGHDTVILDATNVSRRRRDEWRSNEWNTVFKVILTEKEECIRKAVENKQPELVDVIERMCRSFEPIGDGEREVEGDIWKGYYDDKAE